MLLWLLLAAASAHAEWKLVWEDTFVAAGAPNPRSWVAQEGGGGWGNQELEVYRAKNAWIADHNFVIEARHEGKIYTSSRWNSRRAWTYGRFVIRAKIPAGRGTWPAIWMMPADPEWHNGDWPDNGEIDIMEHVGFDYGVVHASLHTLAYNWMHGNQPTGVIHVPEVDTAFHDYVLEWTPEKITFYVDEMAYETYPNPHKTRAEWPFDRPFNLILNVAVGGSWGGEKGIDDSAFPQRMTIESVKVFQDPKTLGRAPLPGLGPKQWRQGSGQSSR